MEDFIPQLEIIQSKSLELRELERAGNAFPGRESEIKAELEEKKSELESEEQKISDIKIRRRKLEKEVETWESSKKKYLSQQSIVKSNVEYAALNKEISRADEKIKALEDEIVELLEQEEVRLKRLESFRLEIQGFTEEASKKLADLNKQRKLLEKKIFEKKEELSRIRSEIPEDTLKKFDRIYNAKQGLVIVPVVRNSCGGCYSAVPHQTVVELKSGAPYRICESCGRLLVLQKED